MAVSQAGLIALVGVLVCGLLCGLGGGGSTVLLHYTLRVELWRTKVAPLRYVHFLDEAAERLLLVKRS